MVEWKWVEGGIQFDGSMHVFGNTPPLKAKQMIEGLDRLVDVVTMLREARRAFLGGKASYAGAGENFSHLLSELTTHENLWEVGFENLGSLFLPRLPVEKVDPSRKAQFMYETLLQLADRINTKKQSAPTPPPAGIPAGT